MKELKKGDKITVLFINDLAMTSQHDILVQSYANDMIVYKDTPRARKLKVYRLNRTEHLAFKGDIPFCSDMKAPAINGTSCFRGNACINLVTTKSVAEIREFVEENLLWPVTDDLKARIIAIHPENNSSNYLEQITDLVYPELYSHCGPLETIKNRK